MTKATVISFLWLLCTGVACNRSADNITLETKHFRYQLSQRGENLHFVDLKSKKDYLYKDTVSYIASIKTNGLVYVPDRIEQKGNQLICSFSTGTVGYVSYEDKNDYLLLIVDSITGPVTSFTFLNIPLIVEAIPDEEFAATVLALNLHTHVEQLPALQNHLWASAYQKFGFEGASVAMVGVPTAKILTTIQQVMQNDAAIPLSEKGGAWALSNKEGYGSYLMDFGSLTIETVDDWIAKCDSLGFNQIAIHGANAFFKNGDLELYKDKWPGGWSDFKTINEKLHKAGISSILLTYAYFIDKKSTLVQPIPNADLGYFDAYTLADALSANATEMAVEETTANVSTTTGYFIQNSVILRIGEELVEFGGVTAEPPYRFTKIKRGVLGTKAQPHPAGAKAYHLMQMFDQFVAGPETKLFDDIARKTATIVNENNFDGIYFDAIDGNNMLGGKENAWYYGSKFIVEVARHLNPMVGMEMCDMPHLYWHYSSRWQAWDKAVRGYKRFVDVHMAALKSDDHRHGEWIGYTNTINRLAPVKNGRLMLPLHMGWWSNNIWQSPQVETTFPDDIEYLLTKMIGNDAGLSMLGGTDEKTLNDRPLFRRLVAMIRQYEQLRHRNYFSEEIKTQLRQPGKEFTLVQESGQWKFKPVVYEKYMATGKISAWTFDNPFEQQPIALRLQAQLSAGNFNDVNNILLSDSIDWQLDTIATGIKSEISFLANNDEKGDRIFIKAKNTEQPAEASWVKWQKKFEPCLDLEKRQGIGVWVKGDSSGALLNFRLESPKHLSMGARGDHFVKIDFNGWRYLELVELTSSDFNNYLWPDEYHNVYNTYFYQVKYNCIDKLQLWLNGITPGKEINIEIGAVKAIPLVAEPIKNITISIGTHVLRFPVAMQPGMYLEYNQEEGGVLYDRNGKLLEKVKSEYDIPIAAPGNNHIRLELEADSKLQPRIEVSVSTRGSVL